MFKLFSSKEKKERPKLCGPQYIYKPFENALSYRVEHREDKNYVYPGWSKSFLYIIEGDKIFRAGEDKPFYTIIGKGIYDASGQRMVYRLGSDAVYSPKSNEVLYVVRNSISVQGTL